MILKSGYNVEGAPNKARYIRNDNGLYTIELDGYIITTDNGQKYTATLRFPNAKLPEWVSEQYGVIDFDEDDIEYFSAKDEASNTIFELVVPDIEE